MITASLISAVGSNTITAGVLGCYVAVFACLLCCFETHIKQVSKLIASNFGFMYSAKSRAVFMVFVGTLMFSFNLVGQLVGALMIANAGFNIFVIIKYPDYDEVQKKDAQAEISEFLQSNPAFAKQVVAAGVKATSDFVSKNPGDTVYYDYYPPHDHHNDLILFDFNIFCSKDLARQGAEAYISAQRKQTIN
jgi:hypothetical protein